MPVYIEDEITTNLVNQLATIRGLTKQDAVRFAVTEELERTKEKILLRERFAALHKAYSPPPPTGKVADKAFFDDISDMS